MELHVSFRGKPLVVGGVERGTPLSVLKEQLEKLTTVPVANQKLIFKGKALRGDSDTLEEAGVFASDGAAKISHKPRLMLVGSTPSEVEVALSGPPGSERNTAVRNDLHGVAVPKGYKRVSLNYQAGPSGFSPYRFQRIDTLPGLLEEEKARQILETLADDPGVKAVLEKHRWTVGALCELYPEGKVGVSDKCVLGLNQNHGMKILLRLRTDDLRGFRKILSIRKVLFHELAHNDISDHNDDFYMLMRQVEREAAELNWKQQSSGRSLAGRRASDRAEGMDDSSGGGYILVKEAFEGGSGRLGGDSDGLQHLFSARELAGQAAVQRLTPEEQEVEDCCGHTSGNKDATAAATAATSAVVSTEKALSTPEGGVELKPGPSATLQGSEETIRKYGQPGGVGAGVDYVTDLIAEVGARSADNDVADAVKAVAAEQSGNLDRKEKYVVMGDVAGDLRNGDAREGLMSEIAQGETNRYETVIEDISALVDLSEERSTTSADQSGSSPAAVVSGIETMDVDDDSERISLRKLSAAQPTPNPADELTAMGFPREDAVAALAATGGSIPDAAYRLLTPIAEATVTAVAERETTGTDGGILQGVNGSAVTRLSRDVRIQRAAETIAGHRDTVTAVQCLETLTGVFRNLMERPGEEKFRKIRRSNGKFKASVGSIPGGVDVLLAAGFEERGTDHLELGREDPGLIWLAKSTLEACRERIGVVKRDAR